MTPDSVIQITLSEPYLLFLGDVPDPASAKTGFGIAHWRPERCTAQMRLPGCQVDLGLPDLDAATAVDAGIGTAIVSVAPIGGQIAPNWIAPLADLARAGIDLAAGMHTRLMDLPELVKAARVGGGRLIDVRSPPAHIPIGTGRKRAGKRVLTVGSDCAVGKKYTALSLHRELVHRGLKASFRATGQTGIMIAGQGIPIDAVVADFVSGAAELLSPDNHADHWDVIEGQGSLFHPSYAGVSLGLLHGSQPDAIVLCHDASRMSIHGTDGHYEVPPIDVIIQQNLTAARLTNRTAVCAGISVNTSGLTEPSRQTYLERLRAETGVPCVDPLVGGIAPIADHLVESGKSP